MKLTKLLLTCSASCAAMTAHAFADPISAIATAIHGFLLSSTAISAALTGTLATIAANAIVVGGGLALSMMGRQRQGGAVKPSDMKSNFETGESSVIELVGRGRGGGLKAFGNTDGSTRARLICHLQGPIDAIEAYYLGQREVTVEPNGDVSSPPWARPGGSWANWQTKMGTGTETAWAGLMSLFPALWTPAHQVRGIAQSQLLFYNPGLAEAKYLSLYQNPSAMDGEIVARGSRIYDPRFGLAAWSENSPIICAHVLRRDPAFTFARFNWAKIAETADAADVLVATKTGTEKRSRLWGMWAWESERGQTMQQFLDSAGLEIRLDENGLIYFEFIDDVVMPEIAFTPEDIYDYSWAAGPEAVERPNICRVKCYSPERLYEITEINLDGISWARIDDEVEKYGPKYLDIELPFCPSASQAQRIARRKFALERADRGTMVPNMVGLAAWGLLYAQITEPDLLDVETVRMEAPRVDDENGSVEIPFVVWPTNPAVDEAAAPDVVPELGYESDMETPDAPYAALQVTYPNGSQEMRIGFNLPSQEYDVAEAAYRTYTGGLPNSWTSTTEYPSQSSAYLAYQAGNFEGQTIDARVRVFKGDEGSYFSDLLNAVVAVDNSAPGAPTHVSGDATYSGTTGELNVMVRANELRAVAIKLQRRWRTYALGTWSSWETISQQNARTRQNLTFTDSQGVTASGGEVEWRLQTLVSDGTGGSYRQIAVMIPGS
ncbi:phage tail protein [Rhizobium halophilum]|uniref:phage tail protein n=1 Tax=Rhizobium halophilum TaxID=2846852 RepID=UPI001EFDE522|nr:phage tail protein [Rhizobium halophilum]MCF6371041.1 phage tail protein [Rhizobium halophilum]